MSNRKKPFIGLIGAGKCSGKLRSQAEKIGETIAKLGGILVCGGLKGVMEAAAKGASTNGGITIGILPGDQREDANKFIDYAIPTGLGEGRNLLVIRTADVIIALPGKFGTLSEMAFCMKMKKPLVSLSAWDISENIVRVENPVEAVKKAIELAGK